MSGNGARPSSCRYSFAVSRSPQRPNGQCVISFLPRFKFRFVLVVVFTSKKHLQILHLKSPLLIIGHSWQASILFAAMSSPICSKTRILSAAIFNISSINLISRADCIVICKRPPTHTFPSGLTLVCSACACRWDFVCFCVFTKPIKHVFGSLLNLGNVLFF